MAKLSVNLNKIALIRNSRGGNLPNLLEAARRIVSYGADGITLHPRPDERHARRQDVYDLKEILTVELNVEGYPSESFLQMVETVCPAQVTLVPDPPEALTSNAGWDTVRHKHFLLDIIARLQSKGIRTSIFVESNLEMIEGAKAIGVDRIELFTGPYAETFRTDIAKALQPYILAAGYAEALDLGINAGHDLDLRNLPPFITAMPYIEEVSIGHALISDALYMGLEKTVKLYKEAAQGIFQTGV